MGLLVQRMLSPVLARLGSRTILGVGGALFLLNMIIPDPIPLVDEFLILAGTILLSRWAKMSEGASSATGAGAEGAMGAPSTPGAPKHVGRGSTAR
jgi:Family of unknown function (DUF6116)